jgi:peroxiredoxin
LPGYRDNLDAIKAKGVDIVAVTAVNDAFVMGAWAKSSDCDGKIDFLADGSAKFAQAIGLGLDLTERGMGMRSRRYSMLMENGVVKTLNVEEGTGAEASGALAMLGQL